MLCSLLFSSYTGFFIHFPPRRSDRVSIAPLAVESTTSLRYTHSMQQHDESLPAARKRKHSEHSDALRGTVVRMRVSGTSWGVIEHATGVNRRTAQCMVKIAHEEGRTTKKKMGGATHSVYSDAVRQHVASVQESDAALRLADLAASASAALHCLPPSLSTVWRTLREADFTTKQMQQYATQRNSPETKEKRKKWVREVGSALTAESSIFIDETPFSMTLMRGRGRSKKGQPALGVVPAIRGKNHSVIAAISPSLGLLYYEIKVTEPDEEFKFPVRRGDKSGQNSKKVKTAPRGVTREVFRTFLTHLFECPRFTAAARRFTLLFDNARIHLGDIADTIFQAGHEQQRLSPWSPELNPIEYVFSQWKFAYRPHYPASEGEVDPAIHASASEITPHDCMKYFEHTKSLYKACEDMEDL